MVCFWSLVARSKPIGSGQAWSEETFSGSQRGSDKQSDNTGGRARSRLFLAEEENLMPT